MDQNNLVCILGLLLILFVVCKYQNKSVSELFGIAGAGSENNPPSPTDRRNCKVLFFYADWCGHCQHFKPEWAKFEEWAKSNGQQCQKIEGDKHPELTEKYKIQGFPTIIKVDLSGELIEEYSGPRSSEGLQAWCS